MTIYEALHGTSFGASWSHPTYLPDPPMTQIDRKRWLIHQNEANMHYFTLIRWVDHLGDCAPHSMTKTAKIDFKRLAKSFFSEFWKNDTIFEISVSNHIRKKMLGPKLWDKSLKRGYPSVRGPAVAMVHTRVRPILSTGTILWGMAIFYQLFKLHHREL